MDFSNYIDPGLLTLIPVLYTIGKFLKHSPDFWDKYIPLTLCAIGIILANLWLLATLDVYGLQDVLKVMFTGFVQGVLCSGTAVFVSQLIKQGGEK